MHSISTIVLESKIDIASPFNSLFVEKRLAEIGSRKGKNTFLESVMTDKSAIILNEKNGCKTTLLPGNKGPKTGTWEQTKQMAFELNGQGIAVTFLPELTFDTCADSLIKIGNVYKIADFKYCITSNPSTLAKDLKRGFEQANTIVLKLKNMDSGLFRKAIDYLLRNDIPYGGILLINNYGRVIELSRKDLKTGVFRKRIKGFL